MRAKGKVWTKNSLLISLVVHAIVFVFLALYVTGTVQKIQEMVNATFVEEAKPKKPEPRIQKSPLLIMTHGGISERSGYRPDIADSDTISIDSPVPVPVLLPQ